MEDAVKELRARDFRPGGNIAGRSKAPRQNKWTCYERKATVLADCVVKVLSSLWWCCSTRTCATLGSDAELTVAVQSGKLVLLLDCQDGCGHSIPRASSRLYYLGLSYGLSPLGVSISSTALHC